MTPSIFELNIGLNSNIILLICYVLKKLNNLWFNENYKICITNENANITSLNDESLIKYKALYSQLIVNYNEDTSLSHTIYSYSIFNMLNYINNNISTLINDVQKEKQNYIISNF